MSLGSRTRIRVRERAMSDVTWMLDITVATKRGSFYGTLSTVLYILYCTYYTVGTEGDHIRSRRQPSIMHTQHKRTAASSPPQGYVASLCALPHPTAHLTPISHIIRQLPRIQSNQNRCETRLTGRQTRHLISQRNRRAVQHSKPTTTPQSHLHCRRADSKTRHGDYLTAADSPMRHPPFAPVTPSHPVFPVTLLFYCAAQYNTRNRYLAYPSPISTPHHHQSHHPPSPSRRFRTLARELWCARAISFRPDLATTCLRSSLPSVWRAVNSGLCLVATGCFALAEGGGCLISITYYRY